MSGPASLRWTMAGLDALTPRDVHDLLRLRVDVFVVEQRCIYPEVDGRDPEALHLLGRDRNNELVAYARILPPDHHGLPHIGRVVVRMDHRGTGLGVELMERALQVIEAAYGSPRSALAAQAHLQKFYEGLGYERKGSEYLWDGIPHVDMERDGRPINGTT